MNAFLFIIGCFICLFLGVIYGIKQTKKNYGIPKGVENKRQLFEYVVDNYEFE